MTANVEAGIPLWLTDTNTDTSPGERPLLDSAGPGDRLLLDGAGRGERLLVDGAGRGERLLVDGAGRGERLLVDGAGRGERPLLLVHGWGGDARAWNGLRFARRRVVTVDLRGHGRSPVLPTGYRPADYAGDLASLVERLELGP
ncbi:MAG: alpha/beta fold hydrolase, partial [Kribbellaceae bacterium]|nr:alpha/beta fold hydrolase [Kribbellaceae bacterium]